jgi:Putative zinc-finger
MVERHADELSLLAYVDDKLDADERRALDEHLEGCPECAAAARNLAAGREALRNAPTLELSDERRRAIVAALPERKRQESFFAPLLRRGPALAAVAALVLVASVIALATQIDGGGGDDAGSAGGGEAAVQEESAQDTVGAAEGDTAQELQKDFRASGPPVRRVEGPPNEVARLLRQNDVAASVEDGAVVADADRAEVRRILVARPRGDVPVYVR